MRYQIDLFIPVTEKVDILTVAASKLQIPIFAIKDFAIVRKSLDARNKNNIHWIYRVEFSTDIFNDNFLKFKAKKVIETKEASKLKTVSIKKSVVIVGMGPAGIFCALSLALSGINCTIIERGKSVESRVRDVERFFKERVLDNESNIQFGEGGAGTFSDGKLTARTKHPFYSFLIKELIEAGAPDEIAYLAKPHIGTDRLRKVVINLRKKLQSYGANILFEERFEKLICDKDKVCGVITNKREIKADYVVLAMGYSARDTLISLIENGLFVESKGFAMGYRLELPQKQIDIAMYGREIKDVPPAEFFHTKHFPNKGFSVFTFCMCPGGTVLPASSNSGELVLNGMSNYKRNGRFGNAAIVVSHNPELWHNKTLGGMALQKHVEKNAFLAAGANYDAPAVNCIDFINQQVKALELKSSYPFSLKPYPVWEFYLDFYPYFKAALLEFSSKMKGLISDETLIIAPETRTSSPYRIKRDENLMSISHKNLFPCGEGAGYSGGIVTSAIDGLKVAEKIKTLG